jgi:prolyl oligopeptidase
MGGVIFGLIALLSAAVIAAPASPPVATRTEPIVDTIHGVPVSDPYRWLEDAGSPEVQRWTDQQNALTRKALDRFPGRKALADRLWQLHEIGALGVPVPRRAGETQRYFYARRDGKQNQPVLYVRDGLGGADRPLVDVNALAADGTRALDWWFPSEDGALVAYGVSADGSEESVLRVRDVATGQDRPDQITRARACSVAWLPDGSGFYYTRYPEPGTVPAGEEKYHRSVFFHRLGADPAHDGKLFGDGRDLKDWPEVALSPDGRRLLIQVEQGWSKSELFLIDTRPRRAPRAPASSSGPPALALAAGLDAHFDVVEVADDRFYVRTNQDAPRGRLFVGRFDRPRRAQWKELLPQTEEILEGAAVVRGQIAALYLKDASSRVRLFSVAGKPLRELPLPGLGSVTGFGSDRHGDDLFFAYTSFLTPTMVFHLSIDKERDKERDGRRALGASAPSVWKQLPAPIDSSAFEVEQVWFNSRDGTRCPLFLIHRKGTGKGKEIPARDGQTPTLLYGYGGFNVNILPGWAPSVAPFLEHGGVYAVAVVRGGGEYGEAWHQAGMLSRKQNVFDDFIAAAEWLIAAKITSPARLAISGRSNGGLLTGAALTQRPDLFRAVISGVPLLDMVRYHKFRIAQLWIPEYGSADDPEQFKWLYAYSPYHHVKDGAAYPAVLIHTAESDTRVDPMHARKMTARLQAATRGPSPVLLRLESKAGHGAGKPLGKVIEQLTDEWSFLFLQLGISY